MKNQLVSKPSAWALILLLVAASSLPFVGSAYAQGLSDSETVALWHLDEIKADGYMEITPDAVGSSHGTVGGGTHPVLVDGKFGKAMKFYQASFVYVPIQFLVGFPPTPEPIYIPVSPNLNIKKELRVEAWVNVQGFTNATYNNIVVKVSRTGPEIEDVTRVFGLAVHPAWEGSDIGVLSGCVYTDLEGFNEIVTVEPVISVGSWIHVAFTRTSTGMHLYINGEEQQIKAIHGVQNPMGSIIDGTEIYIGHDSEVIIDEVRLIDLAPKESAAAAVIDIGDNMLIAIVIAVVAFTAAWVLRKAIQMWVIYSKSRE